MKYNQKLVLSFVSSQELPYISSEKLGGAAYSRKNKSSTKPISINESDRIKAQYMKVCFEAKQSLNRLSSKKSQAWFVKDKKFMISQTSQQLVFDIISSRRKNATQPSEQSNDVISPFAKALDELQIDRKRNHKESLPLGLSPIFRCRKLKPLTNQTNTRIQAEYLRIERAKIQSKPKLQNNIIFQKVQKLNSLNSSNECLSIHNLSAIQNGIETVIKPHITHKKRVDFVPSSRSLIKPIYKINKCVVQKVYKTFQPPFETFWYRDLLWKVCYSFQMLVASPLQYEHRLRVYVGTGNNGGLIRGLMKKRIWFAITDKIEDANFVWAQLKQMSYYNLQKKQSLVDVKIEDSIIGSGILTIRQNEDFEAYFKTNWIAEQRQDEKLEHRMKWFKNKSVGSKLCLVNSLPQIRQQKIQNHFINNYVIGNKKSLFKTMAMYYTSIGDSVFNYLPYTFHIQNGTQDVEFMTFLRFYFRRAKQIKLEILKNQKQQQNVWIVKPGENSNRGNGIRLCKSLQEIKAIVRKRQKNLDGSLRSYIVQMYIEKPLLYNRRKFDIRHFMMMSCANGVLKGYWYQEGYVRTSSSEYSLLTKDGRIHLTNDAIQKQMPDYGKFEKGNKLSYDELHRYLERLYGFKNYRFKDIIIPKMKKITKDIMKASSGALDPNFSNNFQIFGLDFMIDADFNLWLIQVNTNPCLQISCPLLGTIIPKMIENAFELTIDPFFPPPVRYCPKGVHYLKKLQEQNRFSLIYDSRIDGIYKQGSSALDLRLQNEADETFDDEGQEWDEID